MTAKKKAELLNSDEKGLRGAAGLSILWRKVLVALHIRTDSWASHMNHYLNDPANRVGTGSKARSTKRGNLEKSLLGDDTVTWSKFLQGVKVLSYSLKYFRIELHFGTKRGDEYVVTHDLIKPPEQPTERRRKKF